MRAQGLEIDAGLDHASAFLLDLLALFALQAAQKVGEIDIGCWLALSPVELHRAAHHPAGGARGVGIVVVQKQQVRGRQPALSRVLLHGAQQRHA